MNAFFQIALRNVVRNRRRSLITLGALTLGAAAVVMMRALSLGFFSLLVEDVVRADTGAFQVHRSGYTDSSDAFPSHLNLAVDDERIAALSRLPGVTGVAPRIVFSGLASNGLTQTMFIGRGVDVAREAQVVPRGGGRIAAGEPLSSDGRGILLGEELAQSFGVVPATVRGRAPEALDQITLSSSSPTGRANALDVRVVGLLQSPGGFESKRILTVPLSVAQDLIGLPGRATEFAVSVERIESLDAVMAQARELLGPGYEVHPWSEVRPFFRDVIVRQRVILGLVSVVLFVIVLTGIANTMLMSVFERVREIGTMLSVGTRRRQVMALFLMEAGVLGLLGGASGVLLGAVLARLIAQRGIPFQMVGSAHPGLLRPEFDLPYALLALGLAMVGAVAAAAYPAFRASRLDPVEALRAT